jgi:LuxR family quorum-sensing system transcriptional regulator SolR
MVIQSGNSKLGLVEDIMDPWKESRLQSLLTATSIEEKFSVLEKTARELGFDYFAYGMRVPTPVTQPKVYTLNNYPEEWKKKYSRENYVRTDPTVVHAIRSVMPLLWHESTFTSCRPFWEEAQAHGLRFGWAQSCHNARGVGLTSFARTADALTPSEIKDSEWKMSWLVNAAHEFLSSDVLLMLAPEASVRLSSREIEVLRWTAEGKTSGEIGIIMNITERTVNFHVNHAIEKLDASNKTAATIKAAMLGLL